MSAPGRTHRTMSVLTPSYRPDHELCVDLNRSVMRFAPDDVGHTVVVPAADRRLFGGLANARTTVRDVRDVMPRQLRAVPGLNTWVNVRAPFPPVRGWIAQQVVKLAAVADAGEDLVLIADSDLAFVRPFTAATFTADGAVPLYRRSGAVTPHLPRHMRWHAVARRLLGLPPSTDEVRADYVCWPCVWEPAVVRRMLERIERVTGTPWATAVGRELHFSEMMLYGVYVDEIESRSRPVPHTTDMRCPSYSDEIPLDDEGLAAFLSGVREEDVAVMVSARSGTSLRSRRQALSSVAAEARAPE
ncbi:DUF6492 family protein [Cellulomonas aerilata]|uniref:Uncharacterized protein n=1 Tax=Cellulomonas aerilata TaxID=515326 RepID=A0A512DA29_9CELL|nr:DUF6492 family protein [Cellulomonas aerilata]GEO33326.1 hypothetical protein CAE01nite_10510 [Cellulomonas aerilata]